MMSKHVAEPASHVSCCGSQIVASGFCGIRGAFFLVRPCAYSERRSSGVVNFRVSSTIVMDLGCM